MKLDSTTTSINNLDKLTLIILSKNRDRELKQIIDYWARTPVRLVVLHDTNNSLNYLKNSSKLVYLKSQSSIIERLYTSLDYISTPYAMIANDDEIFLIEPLLKFINYLENENDIEAVGGQVVAYNWAGHKLLGNKIYPFLHGFSNNDKSPINRIKKTFRAKNVMDLTLMYKSHEFKNIVRCCKYFTEYSTPVMYETMFAFFSSLFCRSVRLDYIYWMRNWFTPFYESKDWDRKLTWKNWCRAEKFQNEVFNWETSIAAVLLKKTDFTNFEIGDLISLLLNWEAIGERTQNSNMLNLRIRFKNFFKLVIPPYAIWKLKNMIPILRRKIMPDFDVLVKTLIQDSQLSLLDLEKFKNFAREQKSLLKK